MSNDRLKFRAWHPGNKAFDPAMLYPKDGCQSHVIQWMEEGQPVEVMQWTGIYDKDGVEAYQGDIVCQSGHPGDGWPWGNMAIEWDDEDACFCLRNRNGEYGTYLEFEDARCFRVIGNIYESPELMETHND